MEGELALRSQSELERWLEENHDRSDGVWLKAYKKGFGSNALRGTEVLDPLLCYGWITGQARKGTEEYALWWVCPRRRNSLWSKVNVGHAERLIREGRMKPSGLREVEAAREDGRWDAAYPPQRDAALPADFMRMVNRSRKAREFLEGLNRSEVYAIVFRLHNAKDTKRRQEKMVRIVDMLENGETFH
ncbi:MAG: YdeI/OmpD-associated family protein [Nitrososphaerales archaeon]|jgi:uncharacterized protein YdeI (YjbR/CyaY-like superfamily)